MPKKPFYLPDTNEIWLTLTDSSVVAISGKTYEVTKTAKLSGFADPNRGADNGAYDPATHLLYAGVEVFEDFAGSGEHGSTIDVPALRPLTMGRRAKAKESQEYDREVADLPEPLRRREFMMRVEAVIYAATRPVQRET